MKFSKLILLTFLVTFSGLFAQIQRFYYDYKFIPNKNEISDIKEELMVLETHKEGSQFFSDTVLKSDIAIKKDLELQLKTTGQINVKRDAQKGLVRYQISKTYPDFKVFLHSRMSMDRYKVEDTRKMNWNIKNEQSTIGEWKVQKAELNFAGRKWIAWFSTEIPIQDGPYKFHGLPGLIVKIEDETKSHQFELKGIEKIEKLTENIFNSKEISINQKQYAKAVSDYENDPTKGLKQMQMGGIIMIMADGNSGHLKKEEDNIKAKIAKDNNRIELDLVK